MRLRLLLLLPLIILLVAFALSNTQPVSIGLWPTGLTVDAPLSVAILLAMTFAFLVGTLSSWLGGLTHLRRARRAEAQLRALQTPAPLPHSLLPPPA